MATFKGTWQEERAAFAVKVFPYFIVWRSHVGGLLQFKSKDSWQDKGIVDEDVALLLYGLYMLKGGELINRAGRGLKVEDVQLLMNARFRNLPAGDRDAFEEYGKLDGTRFELPSNPGVVQHKKFSVALEDLVAATLFLRLMWPNSPYQEFPT